MLAYSAAWQREIAALMGAEGTTTTGYIRTGGLSLLVGAAIISVWRLLRELVRWIAARLIRRWHLRDPDGHHRRHPHRDGAVLPARRRCSDARHLRRHECGVQPAEFDHPRRRRATTRPG